LAKGGFSALRFFISTKLQKSSELSKSNFCQNTNKKKAGQRRAAAVLLFCFFLGLLLTEKHLCRAGFDSTIDPQSTKPNKKHKSLF
jgi:hypothetical protein